MGKIVLRLDRVMADRKMSLNELSEKVGVSNVNLSKIKTGKISAIRFSTLEAICDVLGILSRKEEELPPEIAEFVRERAEARKEKNWAKSDELRDRIIRAGYILEDTKQGQKVRKDV